MTNNQWRKRAALLVAALVLASLPAVVLPEGMQTAVALQASVSPAAAYWQPSHFFLLYVWLPLLALSGCALFMSPGLLVALGIGAPRNMGEWILQGFAFSLLLLGIGAGVAHQFVDGPLPRTAFLLVVFITLFGGAVLLMLRMKAFAAAPFLTRSEARLLLPLLLAPAILFALLAPKFLWENLNGDGAHAYEAARLLLVQVLPFWNPSAGDVANWPGITSLLFTYPGSWFIHVFGPHEVAARLPVLLYLVCVFAAIASLAQLGRARALSMAEAWLVWLALGVYIVVIGYSATYSPYSADLALPATQDTLVVVCFLGFVLATERRSILWMCLWGLFTFLTLPNGILLMAMWWVSLALAWRPLPVRRLATIAAIGAGCVVLGALLPTIIVALGGFAPGEELKTGALLGRFNFVQLTDLKRFLYVIVPCGIVPAITLAFWRRQDHLSRAITLLTVAYFAVTYVQAYATLHYYVPAMLLPLVVFWRNEWVSSGRRNRLMGVVALGALASFWLSWPESTTPYLAARQVGAAIQDRVGGYEVSSAEQIRASQLFNKILPPDWHHTVPAHAHGGSALTWNFYAHVPDAAAPNYVLQRTAQPASPGLMPIASNGEFVLLMRDSAVWRQHQALRPHAPAGARLYRIPRAVLFKAGSGGLRIFNVKAVLRRLLR